MWGVQEIIEVITIDDDLRWLSSYFTLPLAHLKEKVKIVLQEKVKVIP